MINLLPDTETPLSFTLNIDGTSAIPSEVRIVFFTSPKILVNATTTDNKNFTAIIPNLKDHTTTNEIPFQVEVHINGKIVIPFKSTANIEIATISSSVPAIPYEVAAKGFEVTKPQEVVIPHSITVTQADGIVQDENKEKEDELQKQLAKLPSFFNPVTEENDIIDPIEKKISKVVITPVDEIKLSDTVKGRVKGLMRDVMGESVIDIKMALTTSRNTLIEKNVIQRVKLIKGKIVSL